MIIIFSTRKLEKLCNSQKEAQRKHGQRCGKLLMQRLDELRAMTCLIDMAKLQNARCHELKGEHKGHFSVDLEFPLRLIFEPAENPPPKTDDGGLNWKEIRSVRILSIEDTHE